MSRPSRSVLKPIRILHICRRYLPFVGGTERYIRYLARGQAAVGRQVTVLTLDRDVTGGHRGRLPAHEWIDGVEVLRIPGWGTRQFAVTPRPDQIVRAILRHDVIHTHDLRFALGIVAAATLAAKRPWIFHTHGLIFHTSGGQRLKRALMRMYYGPVIRAGRARVIASSAFDRAMLLRDAPYLKTRVDTFEDAVPLQPLIGASRDPIPGRIATVGRIVPSKGLDDLLAALALLQDVEWSLDIAGEPDRAEVDRLARQAMEAGIGHRLNFIGAFSDSELPALWSSAAVGAFPSRGEGFGMALLEAMAAGVPLCARRIPAHELLLGSELEFLLADFSRPAEAAGRIRALLSLAPGEAHKLSAALRARASSYDISRLLGQVDGLYARIGVPGMAVQT